MIFSRHKDLTEINGPCQAGVYLNNQRVSKFSVETGKFYVGDVLKALEVFDTDLIDVLADAEGTLFMSYKAALVTVGEWEDYVIFGGYDNAIPAEDFLKSHFLTWKRSVSDTYKWSREYLLCKQCQENSEIIFTLYFSHSGSRSVSISVSGAQDSLILLDVSYSTVCSHANLTQADGHLLAYDVSYGSLPVRRYIVRNGSLSVQAFMFRNSLGGIDTIYSHGSLKPVLEYEKHSIVNRRVEREIGSLFKESWKVKSGHIDSKREFERWLDFLASSDRYEVLKDGSLRRIVVEESDTDSTIGKPLSVEFTYRLSEDPAGRYYENEPIEPFDYVISKF